jgi:hypothetical protein
MRKHPIAISPLEPNDDGAFLLSIDQEVTPDPGSVRQARPALDDELEHLTRLSLDDLRLRYRQLTRKAAPIQLSKWLLLRITAYRLQAKAFGDLGQEAVALLDQVAREQGRVRSSSNESVEGADAGQHSRIPLIPPPPPLARFKPGTVLMREHAGEMHKVTVLDVGYGWNGLTYRSLSEVARAITGTSWNGPRFFGLRDAKSRRQTAQTEKAKQPATGGAA